MIATWIAIGVLALAALGVGLLAAREGRRVWTLLASALVFALAGYAWQGSPDLAAAPKQAENTIMPTSENLIESRRGFYNIEGIQPSRYVVMADAFSRRGQHVDAAGLLRNGVSENPQDGEAWLALALALADHTRGRVTPPIDYAFQRAREATPDNPAPDYFRGLLAMRTGDLVGARDFWAQAIADIPEDARGREYVAQQLERLEGVIKVLGERPPQRGPMMQAPAEPR
ncbi:tetratricopeptide repeat protein [Alteriqipengyuania sp. 357]